jgi:hypothetical protein
LAEDEWPHAEYQKTTGAKVREQVALAIKWKRPDVLHWLLRRNLTSMHRYEFQGLIDEFLHTAIETRNEKGVLKLLEYGARLSAYQFVTTAEEVLDEPHAQRTPDQMSFKTKQKMAAEAQVCLAGVIPVWGKRRREGLSS